MSSKSKTVYSPTKLKCCLEDPNICDKVQDGKLYRYFDDEEDAENFSNGNIWFSGINNNRIHHNDPWENSYRNHTRISLYSLSLTRAAPDMEDKPRSFDGKHCVRINNIRGFLSEYINMLRQPSLEHEITWLDKEYVLKAASESSTEHNLSNYSTAVTCITNEKDIKEKPFLCLAVSAIEINEIDYYNDDKDGIAVPLTQEAMKRAAGLRSQYKKEHEVRIELHGTLLDEKGKNIEPLSYHLVEHLKFKCPNVKKYCERFASSVSFRF